MLAFSLLSFVILSYPLPAGVWHYFLVQIYCRSHSSTLWSCDGLHSLTSLLLLCTVNHQY